MELDRSFAAPFPDCVDLLLELTPNKSGKWLGRLVDATEAASLQKQCLGLVAQWKAGELEARRKTGAAGT